MIIDKHICYEMANVEKRKRGDQHFKILGENRREGKSLQAGNQMLKNNQITYLYHFLEKQEKKTLHSTKYKSMTVRRLCGKRHSRRLFVLLPTLLKQQPHQRRAWHGENLGMGA